MAELRGSSASLSWAAKRLWVEDAEYAERYNQEPEKVAAMKIQRTPAIAILGATKDYGIRMYGLPSGYEFGSLVDSILDVSSGDSGLSAPTRAVLAALERPVHLQVFSTPT